MNIGDKIIYKGKKAFVSDKWGPHLVNPSVFKAGEEGYAVVTEDDCRTHILCKEDLKNVAVIG